VACTSLHHVADLDDIVGRIASALVPGGMLIVVEWAWERFDETTARWCFDRLGSRDVHEVDGHDHPGWLWSHRDKWKTSGQPWDAYFSAWAEDERMHKGHDIVRALEARFDTRLLMEGPYVFTDLDGITQADEQVAIGTGQIQATGIRYVGARG
jgi:SAM-dependent methyltransferase